MKKFFLLLAIFGLLASCGKSDSAVSGIKTTEFSGSGFTIQLPEKWTSSGSIADLPSPPNGTVVLGSFSPEKKYNFSDSIIIIEDDPGYIGTSVQYSEQNNLKTQWKYFEYQQLEKSDILFADSDASKYFVFNAKYNTQTQKITFIQTAKFCGTRIYFMNASVALGTDTKPFVDIFRTFQCK